MSVPDITNAKQWHSAGRSKRRRRKCKTVEYISYCLKSNPFPRIMDSEDADRAFCHDYVRMNAEGHAAKASSSSYARQSFSVVHWRGGRSMALASSLTSGNVSRSR